MMLGDKVVIVTGAGGGLGEGIARVCHREGARVVIGDIRGDAAANVAASLGEAALAGAGPYDAAKAGVVGITKSIAVEMAPDNIRVNAISPGLLDTQIWQDLLEAAPNPERAVEYWNSNIPIARAIQPEEIGELAAFLLSDRSRSITGANIFADGGMTSQLVSKEPYESQSIEGR